MMTRTAPDSFTQIDGLCNNAVEPELSPQEISDWIKEDHIAKKH